MTKYKAHRLVIMIVLVVDILNIFSAIGYLILKVHNKGLDYVLKTGSVCDVKWGYFYLFFLYLIKLI